MVPRISLVLGLKDFGTEPHNPLINNIREYFQSQIVPRYNRNIVSDAVISIVSDSRLPGKWVSLSTLEVAFKQQRYDFGDNLKLTSTLMSRVMAALAPDVDSLQWSSNGMCRIQHNPKIGPCRHLLLQLTKLAYSVFIGTGGRTFQLKE